jgi:hypothetical protein
LLAGLGFFICLALGYWFFIAKHQPHSEVGKYRSIAEGRTPESCVEFLELLVRRGLELDLWSQEVDPKEFSTDQPIVVVRRFSKRHNGLARIDKGGRVFIVHYPTEKQARAEAGASPQAFSWGGFVIYGPASFAHGIHETHESNQLFEDIRKVL